MKPAFANTPDPLGGSYFIEKLTLEMENAANEYIERIDRMGGMIPAIEAGFPQSEIASASYRYQREVEDGERVIVGANRFQSEDQPIELLQIDQTAQKSKKRNLPGSRPAAIRMLSLKSLDALRTAAEGTENTMPYLLDAVRCLCDAGRDLRRAARCFWHIY